MPENAEAAPALSTYQDESAFEFSKYQHVDNDRSHLSLSPISSDSQLQDLISKYYSIEETVEFLKSKPECKRITLQFPDRLVCDSSAVAQAISSRLDLESQILPSVDVCSNEASQTCSNETSGTCCKGSNESPDEKQSVWILADTSYSPCCVDEVAAEHVKGDIVIHYGDACLNPVNRIQAGFVFGKPAVNIDSLISLFESTNEDHDEKVLLMADAPHSYILEELYAKLLPKYPNLAYADILQDSFPQARIIGYQPKSSEIGLQLLNRSFHGLQDDEGELEDLLMTYNLFHIGTPEAPRLLKLTTVFQSVSLYDPRQNSVSQGPFPNLMRRYRYMHVARSAGTVGLLVNTLSLANTKIILNKLKQKIVEAGKKHYMFVVGKPNVAKLANFETVDIWCILGCDHQGIIVDQNNEYFKPIITPFELLLALNQELSWTGKWETDFSKLLEQLKDEDEEETHEDESDEEPQFDPVTGRFVSTSKPLRRPQHLQVETAPQNPTATSSDALIERFSTDVVIKDTVSTAAVQLQNRHWTGLGSDYVDDEESSKGALVEDGIRGVARGYEFDVNNKNQ